MIFGCEMCLLPQYGDRHGIGHRVAVQFVSKNVRCRSAHVGAVPFSAVSQFFA